MDHRICRLLTLSLTIILLITLNGCYGRFYGRPFVDQDLEDRAISLDDLDDQLSDVQGRTSSLSANDLLYLTSKHAKENREWSLQTEKHHYDQLLSQVSGVAATKDFLYIFHRGNVTWNQNSFNDDNVYQHQDRPVNVDTIVAVDLENADVMFSWGKDRFYLPHGISVDPQGNLWLTDVALHQAFRYKNNNFEQADLVLGERFVPGSDHGHFCKPTDVAVASTGTVYISDGYCNSRIVVFTPNGHYLTEFANNDNLRTPHSLALLENEDLICVADRENDRIMCYSAGLTSSISSDVIRRPPGLLLFELEQSELRKVYAIAHLGDVILALNGGPQSTVGISIDLGTEQIVDVWSPQNGSFYDAHDLSLTPNGQSFFVCQLSSAANNNRSKIVKFDLEDYPVFISE